MDEDGPIVNVTAVERVLCDNRKLNDTKISKYN